MASYNTPFSKGRNRCKNSKRVYMLTESGGKTRFFCSKVNAFRKCQAIRRRGGRCSVGFSPFGA